ncbi:MAG: hypothetical protein NTW52_15660 [Planctomycetota bacterium]|nr:hypothetical protein [Planctomycetota bacterium]
MNTFAILVSVVLAGITVRAAGSPYHAGRFSSYRGSGISPRPSAAAPDDGLSTCLAS